ncbi:MAG TPA: YtxH domain-containing protein [Thermoanaerobaculia bacterium]
MRDKNRWILGTLAGLAVGLGVGAVLGLLYAPEKGKKTRREIVKRAERLGDRASDVLESAEDLIEAGRRRLAS